MELTEQEKAAAREWLTQLMPSTWPDYVGSWDRAFHKFIAVMWQTRGKSVDLRGAFKTEILALHKELHGHDDDSTRRLLTKLNEGSDYLAFLQSLNDQRALHPCAAGMSHSLFLSFPLNTTRLK